MADSYQMFINGEWVNSSDGGTRDVINPATGGVLASVQEGTAEDANRAVAAAKKAFETWYDSTPKDRQLALLKLADRIEEHGEEIVKLEAENVGKPYAVTMSEELPPIVDNLRFFGGAARTQEGRSAGEYMAGFTSFIRREPIGVAGLIAPWNYPLMMAIWKIGPALATGNCIVLKPSELTPLTVLKMAELAEDLFPPGVFNVITGDGEPVGDTLVRHADVGIVSLTGDVNTGKLIAKNSSDTLKRVHLELGGKAPVIIFDDADISTAVRMGEDRRLLQRRAGLHGGVSRARRLGAVRQRALRAGARGGVDRDGRSVRGGHRGRGRSSRRSSWSASKGSSSVRRRPGARCSPEARPWSVTGSSTSRPSSPT